MAKRRGLGRGLDVLLGEVKRESASSVEQVVELSVDLLRPGVYQPRELFSEEALTALAASIKKQGVLQPLLVRKVEGEGSIQYEILAGERRWRASQRAGLSVVPAIIKAIDDKEALAIALVENIQREDLNPLETAKAIKKLVDEFELTHAEAGELLGRSRSAISNLLRLLDLGEAAQKLLYNGSVEMGHARAVLTLTAQQQYDVLKHVAEFGLSVRATEEYIKRVYLSESSSKKRERKIDPDIVALERTLSEQLGVVAKIEAKKGGKGSLSLKYDSLDQLETILAKIGAKK